MSRNNTVFSQQLKMISRHEFEALAKHHNQGRKLRRITRWSQFIALSLAQLAGRSSLRGIVSNLSAQSHKLYHLGSAPVSRSTLARVNEQQPYSLYEALFSSTPQALPQDFWATYSAFANTDGGTVILGLREKKGQRFELQGVENPDTLLKTLFDTANNRSTIGI